jgi:Ras-related protein Rab-1A
VKHEGHIIKLQIWDTAGQERFRTLTASYYRGAQGIIIVYDVTDRETFDNVRTWIQEIEKYSRPGACCKMLVGNKSDMAEQRQVTTEEGQELANSY